MEHQARHLSIVPPSNCNMQCGTNARVTTATICNHHLCRYAITHAIAYAALCTCHHACPTHTCGHAGRHTHMSSGRSSQTHVVMHTCRCGCHHICCCPRMSSYAHVFMHVIIRICRHVCRNACHHTHMSSHDTCHHICCLSPGI